MTRFVRHGECEACSGDHVETSTFTCNRCGTFYQNAKLHSGVIDDGGSFYGLSHFRSGIICDPCASGQNVNGRA